MRIVNTRKDAYMVLIIIVVFIIGLAFIGFSWYHIKKAAVELSETIPTPRSVPVSSGKEEQLPSQEKSSDQENIPLKNQK